MSKFTSHLDKALGFDGAAKLLNDKGVNALNEELKLRGEQSKAKKPPFGKKPKDGEEADSEEEDTKDWTPLLNELMAAVDQQQGELDALKQADEARVKSRAEADEASGKRIKSLEDANEKLVKQLTELQTSVKSFMDSTPRRASDASETKLDEEDEKKAKDAIRQRTAVASPVFGDLFNGDKG